MRADFTSSHGLSMKKQRLVESTVEIAVQINGKTKSNTFNRKRRCQRRCTCESKRSALGDRLDGKNIIKEIHVPGRIVNIVAK